MSYGICPKSKCFILILPSIHISSKIGFSLFCDVCFKVIKMFIIFWIMNFWLTHGGVRLLWILLDVICLFFNQFYVIQILYVFVYHYILSLKIISTIFEKVFYYYGWDATTLTICNNVSTRIMLRLYFYNHYYSY